MLLYAIEVAIVVAFLAGPCRHLYRWTPRLVEQSKQ